MILKPIRRNIVAFLTLPRAVRSKRQERRSTFIMTSAAVAFLWQRRVCVSRKTSGRLPRCAKCYSSMPHGWKSSTTCLTPHTAL